MYFVRYQPLKAKLRAGTVSDREALPYLMVFLGLQELALALPMAEGMNVWDGIEFVATICTLLGGLWYAYLKNGGAEGFDLITKFVVLGWVVTVRFVLVVVPLMCVFIIVGEATGLVVLDAEGPADAIFLLVLDVVYYQRIGRHIGDTRHEIDIDSLPGPPPVPRGTR